MKIKPLNDRIILKILEAETKTKHGIILPHTAQARKIIKGKVIFTGKGKLLKNGQYTKINVKKNDIVLFQRYLGVTININNEEYLIIKEDDILAVIN